MDQHLPGPVLVQQEAVPGGDPRHRGAQGALGRFPVGAGSVDGVHKRSGTGFGKGQDLPEIGNVAFQIGSAVIGHDGPQGIVGRMGTLHHRLVLRLQSGDFLELLPVKAGIHRGPYPAFCAAGGQLFREPEICLLVAQGHMGTGDRHHIRSIVGLANGRQYLHGQLGTGTIGASQHGLFFFL